MGAVWRFLTANWADKLMALFFAIIIFWVVDDRITETQLQTFKVTFDPTDQSETHTVLIQLRDGYLGMLTDNQLEVKYMGPRQQVQRVHSLPVIRATLNYKNSVRDGERVSRPAAKILFPDVDSDVVRIVAPDIEFTVWHAVERQIDLAPVIDPKDFIIDPDYQIGEPRAERQTVRIRYAKQKFNFTTVDLVPVHREAGIRRRLEPGDNPIPFKVVLPEGIETDLVTADPAGGEIVTVSIPVLPKLRTKEIEVRIDLILPSDGSIAKPVRAEKPRETFKFTGAEDTLRRCKKLERSNREIRAMIDLSQLSADQRKQLEDGGGLSLKPTFRYPDFAKNLRCEREKVVWVRFAKDGSE